MVRYGSIENVFAFAQMGHSSGTKLELISISDNTGWSSVAFSTRVGGKFSSENWPSSLSRNRRLKFNTASFSEKPGFGGNWVPAGNSTRRLPLLSGKKG